MTDQPTDPDPDPAPMPRWIPILIAAVLVVFAALALITGWRNRENTLTHIVESHERPPRSSSAAPPGEPDAGSSLMFPGNAPTANPAVSGPTRLQARRGMVTNVLPEDAVVYVNDLAIGQVRQFNTMEEVYDFPAPGSYTIHISAPGYKDQQFIVTVAEDAKQEIARISAKLSRSAAAKPPL
ncbi:MAG TPA: hypothetical protein VMU84_21170 [Thermoanaerobaculia bacterium]|nr:hypothetical protein [Thermoanaerobaculia bacterium]